MHAQRKETVHPGVEYVHYTDDSPLSVHILKADPNVCRIVCAKGLNNGIGRECLPTIAGRYDALGAINGGYFTIGGAYDGRSSGMCKILDRWFSSPFREASTIAWNDHDPRVECSRGGIIWSLKLGDRFYPIDYFNSPIRPEMASLFSWAMHRSTLTPKGTLEVVFKDGTIISVHKPGGDTAIPSGAWVYALDKGHADYGSHFEVGMKAELNHRFVFFNENFEDVNVAPEYEAFWQNADYLMSGGPILIKDGVETSNYDKDILKQSVMYTRQPRSVIAVTENNEWLFAAVEGRQPRVSKGMDVMEVASFLKSIGCKHALNMDGGASVLMMVEGKIINTPMFNGIESDDELGQRRIADALLVVPR
ncbi:MAG: phosphodiester glycosidase family protein [Parachlamydiales bacterium]|jgi:hypothetical protein